jgi:hypothetical protein
VNHIPLPRNPALGYLEVPCLTDQEYDELDPETFPERQGYQDRTARDWKTMFERPTPKFVAFMQLWRYFGYIRLMFPFATMERLTRVKGNGKRVFDTSNLVATTESNIEGWKVDGELLDNHKLFHSIEDVLNTDSKGKDATSQSEEKISLYHFLTSTPINDPLPHEIVESIWLVHEFVVNVSNNFQKPLVVDRWRPPIVGTMLRHEALKAGTRGNAGLFGRRMLDRGWCPSHLEELKQRTTWTDMIYIANLSSPDSLDHRACIDTTCRYAHVDNPSYQTKHAEGCDGCLFVSAELDQLSAILRKETYPLIDFSKPTTPGSALCLQPFASPEWTNNTTTTSTPMNYVAISHV